MAEHAIRLRVRDDLGRSRLTVLVRLLLALPHLVWLLLWLFAAVLAALASWPAPLVAGRSPAALHGFLAAFLRSSAHVAAYLGLIADPYPGFRGRAGSYPVDLEIEAAARQSRLVTVFRPVLALPAFVLASVLQEVLQIVAVLGWFCCLALGRMPRGMRDLGAYCLRYQSQTFGYALLLTHRYPSVGSGLVLPA